MSARTKYTAAASAIVLTLVLGCATEPNPPTLVGATFELRLFNGSSPPIRFSEQDSGTYYEILREVLVFTRPDSLAVTAWVRQVAAAQSLDTVHVGTGTAAYTMGRFGQLKVSHPCCVSFECGGPPCPAIDVGSARGDTIELLRDWDVRRPVMVYVRSARPETLSNRRLKLPGASAGQ
jgi:hypothetical protein